MQPQNTTLVEPGVYKMDLGVGSDGITPQIKYVDKTGANLMNYKPAMQTTSQQTRQDATTGQKIDAMAGQTPTAPNANVQNNGQPTASNNNGQPQQNQQNSPTATNINFKNPDGTQVAISETVPTNGYSYQNDTPLIDGEKYGYDTNGKRYIISKDGSVKNDAQADKEYEINKAEIIAEKNKNDILDKIQATADTAHANLIDSIRKKSAYNRQLQKDTNARYLALKQNEGFSGGTARYMSDINNGVLQDTENKAIEALNKIDVDEQVAIAEASAAKTDKDFERAYKKMNEIDQLQKDKRTAILDLMKATNDRNKALSDQQKAIADAEKAKTDRGIKILDTGAPAITEAYDALKTQKEKDTAVENYAKKIGVTVEEVLGSIKEYRDKDSKAKAELKQTEAQTRASDRSNTKKGERLFEIEYVDALKNNPSSFLPPFSLLVSLNISVSPSTCIDSSTILSLAPSMVCIWSRNFACNSPICRCGVITCLCGRTSVVSSCTSKNSLISD